MSRPERDEERLRALLEESAELLVPRGDGLARIQQRLAERRSPRRFLAPGLALAGVVAVASVGAYGAQLVGTDRRQPAQVQTAEPAPSGSCAGDGLCTEPRPTPTGSAPTTDAPLGTPIWPYSGRPPGEAPAWTADPSAVAQRFVAGFLGLPGVTSVEEHRESASVAAVRLLVDEREAGVVRLVRVGGDAGPWSVTGVTASGLDVPVPDEVSSPQDVTGRVDGVDQSVHVRVVTARGDGARATVVAEQHVAAGSELPWRARLTWSDDDWEVGGLVASTADGNGVLHHLHVTAVRHAAGSRPPGSGTAFVAVERGRIVLVDASTGRRTRQLSYPPEGRRDSSPARGGRDGVVFVRASADGCTDTQLVRVGLTDGPAGVTVRRDGFRLSAPSLSDDGRWLAWVQTPCAGGDPVVVVRGPDAVERALSATSEPTELDVADDGSLLVVDAAGVRLAGAQAWPGRRLPAAAGCRLTSAARDAEDVVAFELCGGSVRVTRYSFDGARLSQGPALRDVEPVRRTAVAGGRVLLWAGEEGFIAELVAPGSVTALSDPEGCASDQQPDGCFAFPDW